MTTLCVRPLTQADYRWVVDFLREQWGGTTQAYGGRLHHVDRHAGFVALQGDKPVGLLTYRIDRDECEISSLKSLVEGVGAGSALVAAVKDAAAAAGCRRLSVVTTNDNMHALRFYQKLGFSLAAVRRNAVDEARRDMKPEIPLVGLDGIPIRDEIELEMLLGEQADLRVTREGEGRAATDRHRQTQI
jgi:ribosomal protein S18 acetylase RimI-like enzyme